MVTLVHWCVYFLEEKRKARHKTVQAKNHTQHFSKVMIT